MYIHDKIESIDGLLKENLHVHSTFSGCAAREMTLNAIVERAKQAGLERIAIVDHYNNNQNDEIMLKQVRALRKTLSTIDTDIRVLIGCELSAYGVGKWLDGEALRNELDYRLYSCNHYHLDYWQQPEDRSPQGYARHMVESAGAVIAGGNADCIAHPFTPGYIRIDYDKQLIADALTDNMLGDVFTLAVKHETAIELNCPYNDSFGLYRRMLAIGKETGVVFNYGTDAHRLNEISTVEHLNEVKLLCK